MNLGEIREKIDQTDMQLVKLINQRMEYVLRAGKLKEVILDKAREEQVLRQLLAQARGLIRPEFITTLYESILTESKALQERNLKLVGFQGEHGAWGELAIRSYADDMIPIPCVEFAHVFEGVRDRELDMGMVPVENSLEGAVTEVNDILVDTDLKIIGEIRIPVRQCLLVLPGETTGISRSFIPILRPWRNVAVFCPGTNWSLAPFMIRPVRPGGWLRKGRVPQRSLPVRSPLSCMASILLRKTSETIRIILPGFC